MCTKPLKLVPQASQKRIPLKLLDSIRVYPFGTFSKAASVTQTRHVSLIKIILTVGEQGVQVTEGSDGQRPRGRGRGGRGRGGRGRGRARVYTNVADGAPQRAFIPDEPTPPSLVSAPVNPPRHRNYNNHYNNYNNGGYNNYNNNNGGDGGAPEHNTRGRGGRGGRGRGGRGSRARGGPRPSTQQ